MITHQCDCASATEGKWADIHSPGCATMPRPYNLDDHDEMRRLYRETSGYLKTCHQKHGTDWEGRRFAIEALDKLFEGPRR